MGRKLTKQQQRILEERRQEQLASDCEHQYKGRIISQHGAHVTLEDEAGNLHKASFRQSRSEEHTSELQSRFDLVCRLLLEKKNISSLEDMIHVHQKTHLSCQSTR